MNREWMMKYYYIDKDGYKVVVRLPLKYIAVSMVLIPVGLPLVVTKTSSCTIGILLILSIMLWVIVYGSLCKEYQLN